MVSIASRRGAGSAGPPTVLLLGKLLLALLLIAGLSRLRRFEGFEGYIEYWNTLADGVVMESSNAISTAGRSEQSTNWCDTVAQARVGLLTELAVTVPCKHMKPARAAVVTYLTAGLPDGQGKRAVFTGTDYINGALALGASLQDHLTLADTHRLLLVREGFTIPDDKAQQLEAVGWTLGKAPIVEVAEKYVPKFERYKTVYTKISVLGLSEYRCVLLLDADALSIGNIDDLLSCDILQPHFQVAGALDYYRGSWYHFNTGSALWRTSPEEMNRVYGLTKDPSFMKRFQSDQIFTNTAYPDRINQTLNQEILAGTAPKDTWGRVAHLGWEYNAQTHVEYQLPDFWQAHLGQVKILHYTERKGWQCPERHGGPQEPKEIVPPKQCRNNPGCACDEGYRWYDYLDKAKSRAAGEAAKL